MPKIIDDIIKSAPGGRWPYGMPFSFPGNIIFIGDTPGNSPDGQDRIDYLNNDYSPVVKSVHNGFYYKDTKGYWERIRMASGIIGNSLFGLGSVDESLAITGHFNCGVARSGSSLEAENEIEIIKWINHVLANIADPQIVILVGLIGKLKSNNVVSDNLLKIFADHIDWNSPDYSAPFSKYKIREWRRDLNGKSMKIFTTPNHPSRHPFKGMSGLKNWEEFIGDLVIMANR